MTAGTCNPPHSCSPADQAAKQGTGSDSLVSHKLKVEYQRPRAILKDSNTLFDLSYYRIILLFFLMVMNNLPSKSQSYIVPQLFNGESTLDNQYGITSHITWPGYDYDHYERNFSQIKGSGNYILRTDYSAAVLKWGKGNVDFTVLDNVYSAAKSKSIQLLPMIYHHNKTYNSEHKDSYENYLTTIVNRYGDNVVGWEVGNELDLQHVQDGSIPPSEYLSVLKDTYTTIKRTNADNQVLLGAIGDLKNHYLEDLLDIQAAEFFDILSIHYYSGFSIPETIIPFYERLEGLLKQYQARKPIWLTETGYRSYRGEADQDVFYTKILPYTYQKLGIDISKSSIGLLYDQRVKRSCRNQDNKNIYSGFKTCHIINLDELKTLSVKDYPVLMILFREFFPKGYHEDLLSYVKRGGTIVFPEGGAALFNELDLKTNELKAVGKIYYPLFHINYMFQWDTAAKSLNFKKISKITTLSDINIPYAWQEEDMTSSMYLLGDNLKEGDNMIPLVYGTEGQSKVVVAACYRLNSDLKGNIIIQTRPNLSSCVPEHLQSSRIPRVYLLSYAMGVDKVMFYCLRDRLDDRGYGIIRTNDERKQSFETLTTLSRFLPSGSDRPQIVEEDDQYIASWKMPEGKKVYCVWSSHVGNNKKVKVSGRARYYNEVGKRIRKRKFNVSPQVTYILGASSVSFE